MGGVSKGEKNRQRKRRERGGDLNFLRVSREQVCHEKHVAIVFRPEGSVQAKLGVDKEGRLTQKEEEKPDLFAGSSWSNLDAAGSVATLRC